MDRLTEIMQARGVTPEALAVRLNAEGIIITAACVRTWIRGNRVPNFRTAQAVARALGCTLNDLASPPVAVGK